MYCKSCGHKLDTGMQVCPYCGRPAGAATGGNSFIKTSPEPPAPSGGSPAADPGTTAAITALAEKLKKAEKRTAAMMRRLTVLLVCCAALSLACIGVCCVNMLKTDRSIKTMTEIMEKYVPAEDGTGKEDGEEKTVPSNTVPDDNEKGEASEKEPDGNGGAAIVPDDSYEEKDKDTGNNDSENSSGKKEQGTGR